MLDYWFILQLLSGATSFVDNAGTGGVAFWAHLGGFIAGIIVVKLFPKRTDILLPYSE